MRPHYFIGIIIILAGLSFLFNIPVFNIIIALVLLWIGVRILTGHKHNLGNYWSESKSTLNEDYLSRVLVFSGMRKKLVTDNFEGIELISIFGGAEIDASEVKTGRKEIDIELVSIFGGIKLKVPKGWLIKSEGMGILGGFDNNTGSKNGIIIIHLKGVAILGGVEVVN